MVIRWRKRRGGEWVPEDRLRAGLPAMATLVPLSVLLFGLTAQYVDGRLGIVLNLVWLFMNGIGVRSSQWYLVQIGDDNWGVGRPGSESCEFLYGRHWPFAQR